MKRDFKGIWIPKSIWLDESLTPTEKCLLAEIHSLDSGGGCFASNEFLASRLSMTPPSLANLLTKLRSDGRVKTVKTEGNKRWLSIVECKKTEDSCKHEHSQSHEHKDHVNMNSLASAIYSENTSDKITPVVPIGDSDHDVNASLTKSQKTNAELVYAEYPKKVGRAKALLAIERVLKNESFEFIKSAVAEYAAAVRKNIESGASPKSMKYVPSPERWFNSARFHDDRSLWIEEPPRERRTRYGVSNQLKAIEEAISTHIANPEAINGLDRPSAEQRADLEALKVKRKALLDELNNMP